MGQADRQFAGFLRMLIARLKKAVEEKDSDKMREAILEIITDLQNTLED